MSTPMILPTLPISGTCCGSKLEQIIPVYKAAISRFTTTPDESVRNLGRIFDLILHTHFTRLNVGEQEARSIM